MKSQLFDEIEFKEGEGVDRLEGTSDEPVKLVEPSVPSYPVYHEGSAGMPGITTSTLYPGNLGESVKTTLIAESLDRALRMANDRLRKAGKGIMVVSGYISPEDQQAKFVHLFKTYLPNGRESSDAQIMEAGIQADKVGSLAALVEDEAYEAKLAEWRADTSLHANLWGYLDPNNPEPALKKYLTILANAGWVEGLTLDYDTATTVHNLGHSANVVLTDDQGNILPTGRALDVPSSTQPWNAFENITPQRLRSEVRRNELLERFLRESGVNTINAAAIETMRANNRTLFNAVMRGKLDGETDVFAGEGGHVSIRRPEYPNRIGVEKSLANWRDANPTWPRYTLA